jgi:hypothetical protein
MGIGFVIGAFVMTCILLGVFLFLRKKSENRRKNAVIMVTEENGHSQGKNNVDENKLDF